jgi:hypothetical protein
MKYRLLSKVRALLEERGAALPGFVNVPKFLCEVSRLFLFSFMWILWFSAGFMWRRFFDAIRLRG